MNRESCPRGPRLAPHPRRRCVICGAESVAHTAEGRPFAVHQRTRRHTEALARQNDGEAVVSCRSELARVAAGAAPA